MVCNQTWEFLNIPKNLRTLPCTKHHIIIVSVIWCLTFRWWSLNIWWIVNLGLFYFYFFITYHFSLNFCHSSPITHHSLLKIPQIPNPTCLTTVFTTHHSNISTFLWSHTYAECQTLLLFQESASPFHPFNRVPLPPFSSSLISSKNIKAQKIKAESKAQKASSCEQALASITCKANAAALCVTCNFDIHSKSKQRWSPPHWVQTVSISTSLGPNNVDVHLTESKQCQSLPHQVQTAPISTPLLYPFPLFHFLLLGFVCIWRRNF